MAWHSISRARAVGVNFVCAGQGRFEVPIELSSEPIEGVVSISDHARGIILESCLRKDGALLKIPIITIGQPSVFGVALEGGESDDSARAQISFHPMIMPHEEELITFRDKPLLIPEQDITAFILQWLPKLMRRHTIVNESAHVILPELFASKLAVQVRKKSVDTLEVDFGFQYDVVKLPLRAFEQNVGEAVASDARAITRDMEKERTIEERAVKSVMTMPQFWSDNGPSRLRDHVEVQGLDALAFVERVLPIWEAGKYPIFRTLFL